MLRKFLLLFNLFFLLSAAQAIDNPVTFQIVKLNSSIKEDLKGGEIYAKTHISSFKAAEVKKQGLKFEGAALHPKSCAKALRKISLYEDYKNFVPAVQESTFDEKTEQIHVVLAASYLPMKLSLDFKLPRMSTPGLYPFTFTHGFLQGLAGHIHVSQDGARCFFYVTADWTGADTGFNDTVFTLFTETLAKLSMQSLIRASSL